MDSGDAGSPPPIEAPAAGAEPFCLLMALPLELLRTISDTYVKRSASSIKLCSRWCRSMLITWQDELTLKNPEAQPEGGDALKHAALKSLLCDAVGISSLCVRSPGLLEVLKDGLSEAPEGGIRCLDLAFSWSKASNAHEVAGARGLLDLEQFSNLIQLHFYGPGCLLSPAIADLAEGACPNLEFLSIHPQGEGAALSTLAAALESRDPYLPSSLYALNLTLPNGVAQSLGRMLRSPSCRLLKHLTLSMVKDDDVRAIGAYMRDTGAPRLASLELSHLGQGCSGRPLFEAFASLAAPNLSALDLSGFNLDDGCAELLDSAIQRGAWGLLQELKLSPGLGAAVEADILGVLGSTGGCELLEELQVYGERPKLAALADAMARGVLPALHKVEVDGGVETAADHVALSEALAMRTGGLMGKAFSRLDISGTGLVDMGLGWVTGPSARVVTAQISSLKLDCHQLTPRGVQRLFTALCEGACPKLCELALKRALKRDTPDIQMDEEATRPLARLLGGEAPCSPLLDKLHLNGLGFTPELAPIIGEALSQPGAVRLSEFGMSWGELGASGLREVLEGLRGRAGAKVSRLHLGGGVEITGPELQEADAVLAEALEGGVCPAMWAKVMWGHLKPEANAANAVLRKRHEALLRRLRTEG
jgi:hypothetical protein